MGAVHDVPVVRMGWSLALSEFGYHSEKERIYLDFEVTTVKSQVTFNFLHGVPIIIKEW